jgi:cell division protease FtsH
MKKTPKETAAKKASAVSRKPPKTLSALRASATVEDETAAGEADGRGFDLDDDDGENGPPAADDPRENATAVVVGAAFEAALTRGVRRRLRHGQALAVVVVVPTQAWVVPAAAYARSAFGDRWCMQTREGTDRRLDASVGSVDVARNLSGGMCVMGIAADAGLLPAALTGAADVTIRIAAPDGTLLRRAITRFARRSPGELPGGIAAGLDLHEIIAAFRPGTGAQAIARRLAAAGAGRGVSDRVPALETAVEYGDARVWGLKLARDIAEYRAGTIAWRDVDRGVCLHSPPGMGKSLFAQVLARACGVPLVSTSVGQWFADGPGYPDSVIKQMRGAFARAAALASPCCILFLDEIDALPDRETLSERGRDWWMPVITDALLLLDSAVDGRTGIVVVGATNAIERVDRALLRPGRLETVVAIPAADAAGAVNIARFHLDGELRGDDLAKVGALLDGSTGAEIMLAVRSARRSARHACRALAVGDIERAALPVADIPAARLFRMAVHEAAHAVAALAVPVGSVRHVTLGSRAGSGGRTVIDFIDADLWTRRTIEDRVVVGLAARAAERIFTGEVSTGGGGTADSDLGMATTMVASLHASYGMGGGLAFLGARDGLLREVALNSGLRASVERHLRELEVRAAELVEANRDSVLAVAARLADRRHVGGKEIEEMVRGRLVAPVASIRRRPSRKRAGC